MAFRHQDRVLRFAMDAALTHRPQFIQLSYDAGEFKVNDLRLPRGRKDFLRLMRVVIITVSLGNACFLPCEMLLAESDVPFGLSDYWGSRLQPLLYKSCRIMGLSFTCPKCREAGKHPIQSVAGMVLPPQIKVSEAFCLCYDGIGSGQQLIGVLGHAE